MNIGIILFSNIFYFVATRWDDMYFIMRESINMKFNCKL